MPPMKAARTPLKLLVLLAALMLALGLAACGGGDDSTDSVDVGDLGPDPATMAPADAPFYAEAVLRPQGTMRDDLESALSKLLATDDPFGMIREQVDASLASDPQNGDYTLADDIEPWLGPRAGGFVTDYDPTTQKADGAVAVAITDGDAAQAFIQKGADADASKETDETYQGVDYLLDESGTAVGIDGDFLIAGTEQGFKDAVDAGAGDSLAEDPDATTARADVPENSLFSAFVDTPAVIDLVKSSGALSGAQLKQFEDQAAQYSDAPIDFWGTASPDDLTVAGSGPSPSDGGEPSDLINSFPADSWLAFASADVGKQLQSSIDQFKASFQDLLQNSSPSGVSGASLNVDPLAEIEKATGLDLSADFTWIGDAGGFVEGSSFLGLGGGLVLEATDEGAASDTIGKLETALKGNPQLQVSPSDSGDGFSIQVAGAPVGAEVALQDGKVVIAFGGATVDDVVSASDTLDGSDRFTAAREALGEDVTPSFFLDFSPVISLIESTGQATQDPSYQQAKPYLSALDYLVSGSRVDSDGSLFSLVLGLRDPGAASEDATAATITP
jgi:hypothetical protein